MLQAGKNLNTAKMLEKAKQYPFKQLICQDIEAQLPYEFPFDAIRMSKPLWCFSSGITEVYSFL